MPVSQLNNSRRDAADPACDWHEPTLDDLLSEPIIGALMEADEIDPEELRAMLRR